MRKKKWYITWGGWIYLNDNRLNSYKSQRSQVSRTYHFYMAPKGAELAPYI